jgi:predicted SAM-dependent methyltransferase
MKCLNLGCGRRFHPAWTNVDFVAVGSAVLVHDLRKGVPFPDGEFDLVYHSHLLEHFDRSYALRLLRECFRVLKPGGTIRIAVPDLERIVKTYLQALERSLEGDEMWRHNYEWIMLELYDQTVRERSSGEMGAYFCRERIPNKEFVVSRIGMEARQAIEAAENARNNLDRAAVSGSRRTTFHRLFKFLRDPVARREAILRLLLGAEYERLQLGRFRRGGEVHMWMYDRYSLAQLLCEAGFQQPHVVGPTESRIPTWTTYQLDTEADGTVYKPDSLFMEAFK